MRLSIIIIIVVAAITGALWITRGDEPGFDMDPATPDYHTITQEINEGNCTVLIEGHTIDIHTMQPIEHIECHAGL